MIWFLINVNGAIQWAQGFLPLHHPSLEGEQYLLILDLMWGNDAEPTYMHSAPEVDPWSVLGKHQRATLWHHWLEAEKCTP